MLGSLWMTLCKKQNICLFSSNIFFSGEIVIEFQEFNVDGVKHGQNANCLESDRFVVEQQIRGLGWRQIRRYCGNWNEKLKAIHVVTKTSSIRIGSMLYPMHKNEKSRRGFVAKVGHEYKHNKGQRDFDTGTAPLHNEKNLVSNGQKRVEIRVQTG